MAVLAIGISHKTAPVEVRERFAFSPAEAEPLLASMRDRFGGGVVLSTCNRTEVYVSQGDSEDAAELARVILEAKGEPGGEGGSPFAELIGMHAVRHLYRVSSGIDSMVVGEAQILGQVREAMLAAQSAGALNQTLSRLFHSAVTVGRLARSRTDIGRHAVSVSSAGVALARKVLGDLGSRTVLIVSAGEAGKLAARHVAEYGPTRLLVTNRRPERAADVAARLGGSVVPFAKLASALVEADLVISSSGSTVHLVDRKMVERAMRKRGERPLVLIDMAVPRDIDPEVRDVPGVYLYDIDDLQSVAVGNINARLGEVEKVERIVEAETARFAAWWRAHEVVPTIAALRERAEAIRQAELARTVGKLSNLSDDERRRVEAMTTAMMKRLLHEPIDRLRRGGRGARYVEAVQELFALHPGEDRDGAPPK